MRLFENVPSRLFRPRSSLKSARWASGPIDGLDLRPHIAAETFGFHRAEDNRHVENLGGFQKRDVVINDRLAVEIGDAEEHLRLQIDNCHHTVVGSQQSFFTTFRTSII